MTRKCSMCGEAKDEKEFRFMRKQNRHNAYCKDCERWYNTQYKRVRREMERGTK